MARPTQPGKRGGISILDAVIVIGGVILIVAFNRVSISKLQRSLPNVNSQIVGEWKDTRGPERLIFRADKTIAVIPAKAAEPSAPAAAPPESSQTASATEPVASPPATLETAASETGKYQLVSGGTINILMETGQKYTTMLKPEAPNRLDLINVDTQGVTTYERVP